MADWLQRLVEQCSIILFLPYHYLTLYSYWPSRLDPSKTATHLSPKRGLEFFTAEMTALSITLADSRPRTLKSASTCPVAMVNMVSPSNMECAGRMVLA